jgi:hypothetical protein
VVTVVGSQEHVGARSGKSGLESAKLNGDTVPQSFSFHQQEPGAPSLQIISRVDLTNTKWQPKSNRRWPS